MVEDENLFGGMTVITGEASKRKTENWGEALYRPNVKAETESIPVKNIPFFAWANRGLGEMQVWVNEKETR